MKLHIKPRTYPCKYCGAPMKLTRKRGIAKCEYCGSEYMLFEEEGAEEKKKTSTMLSGLTVTLLVVLAVACLFGIWTRIRAVSNRISEYAEEPAQSAETHRKSSVKKEDPGCQAVNVQFQEAVFRKSKEDITEEDLQRIKYLDYSVETFECVIVYRYALDEFDPDTDLTTLQKVTLSVPEAEEYSMAKYGAGDFDEFLLDYKGLQAVNVSEGLLENYDLSELPDLQGVMVQNDVDFGLLNERTDGSRLDWMKLQYVSDLTGIEALTAVKEMKLSDCNITSLTPLAACEGLKKLVLADNNSTLDYKELSGFSQLESLNLDTCGDQTKILNSIGEMTKLRELAIKDTQIKDLNFISGLDQLESLTVRDNNALEDFSALKDAKNLTDLTIDIYGQYGSQPDMSAVYGLTGLKHLTLCCVYDRDILKNLKNLETLHISYGECYGTENYLAAMKNLRVLQMSNMFSTPDDFSCLAGLSQLTTLDVSHNDFHGDMSSLFQVKQIQELNLNGSSCCIDPSKISGYRSLERLYLSGLNLQNSYYNYDTSQYISMEIPSLESILESFSDASELKELNLDYDTVSSFAFLKQFPKLEALYANYCELSGIPAESWENLSYLKHLELSHNEIPDLEFASGLSGLEYLDIQSNYVTDLTPIGSLSKLQVLITGDNPL